jgi:prepilin-type N-terminal cleavage/methylation domain-containing protein
MNKKAGFTLAELLVSMAIFVIIIGAIAALFGTSLKAMVYGKNQERAYAEARNVMNDIKTTLRYADDKNKILPELTSTSVEYGGTMIINNDPSNTNSKVYTRNISFNTEKNRLEIAWTGFYPGESGTSGTKTIYFPAKGHEGDSAFNTDEYRKACQDMFTDNTTPVPDIPFPIFKGTYEGKDVFNIVLPIQYTFEGGKKVEILRSRVASEEYEETEANFSRFSGSSSSDTTSMNSKNKDLIKRVLATDPTKSPGVGKEWRSQDLLWRWLNLTDTSSVMGPGYEKVTDAEIKEMFTNRGLTLPTKYTTYYWRPLYVYIDGDEDTGTTDGTYEWTSDIWFVSPFKEDQNNSTTERYAFAIYWNKKLYLPTANANGTATVVQVTSLTPWAFGTLSYTTYTAFWQSLAASSIGFVYVGKVSF